MDKPPVSGVTMKLVQGIPEYFHFNVHKSSMNKIFERIFLEKKARLSL